MDDIVEKFESTLGNEDPKGDNKNFETLYKNWGKLNHQEERRKELLEIQKSNRNNSLDKFRGILDLVSAEENHVFRSYKGSYRPSIYVAGFNKASASYNNVLMLSEWMIEKPSDFVENWYVTPCPKGVRMLIVARGGRTKFYTKYGHFKFECSTLLPGGNMADCNNGRNRFCVLDGFYQEKNKTMYLLDLLAWVNQFMTDGETEFRHYWLKTQLDEIPGIDTISKRNKIKFFLLPKVPCTPDLLDEFMMKYPPFDCNFPPLDGLLFYHKQGHYLPGQTPLVGWLYPYMVPEVLGAEIKINAIYALQKPADYINQADYIQRFEEKMAKKKYRSRLSFSNDMDTADEATNKVEPETKENALPEKIDEPNNEEKQQQKEAEETATTTETDSMVT